MDRLCIKALLKGRMDFDKGKESVCSMASTVSQSSEEDDKDTSPSMRKRFLLYMDEKI